MFNDPSRRFSRINRFSAATALAASLCWAVAANAQSAQPGPPQSPDANADIVVTATKRPQRLQDVSASIVAITGAELEHTGQTTLRDLLKGVPGLSNPGNGGSNFINLTIRGINTSATNGLQQNTVAQLYDDITLDPIANAGTTNLRFVDIDRVEVLRGPQGTLFGSGSLAGAIRYITNKPNLNTASGSAEVSIADTKGGRASWSVNGMVNLPLIDDKLGLRVVGYHYLDGDWITNLRTNQKRGGVDTSGFRAILRAKPSDRLTVDLTAMYQNNRDHAGTQSNYFQPAGSSSQVSDGSIDQSVIGKSLIAGLNIQYDLDGVTLTSASTFQRREFDVSGTDYYYVPFVTGMPGGVDNTNSPHHTNIFSQEVRLSSSGSGPLKWTIGGYFLQGNVRARYIQSAPVLTPLIGGPIIADLEVHSVQKEIAGFGELTYTAFRKLDLTAGVRVAQSKVNDDLQIGGLFTPTGIPNVPPFYASQVREKDNPVTPHFSITYRYTPDLSIYVSAARGFRVGGTNKTAGPLRPTEPQSYAPDTLWNYEAGAKGKAFEGRLSFAANVYYIRWSNLQVPVQTVFGNYTGNASGATLYGFEGQFDARITDALQMGASVNFANNKVNKFNSGVFTDVGLEPIYKGYLLPASPEQQGFGYAEYDFALGGHKTYIRGSGNYIGPQWTGFNKEGIKFGKYATADLRAGIEFEHYEVAAFVNNLFNSQGKQSASQPVMLSPSITLVEQYAYRLRPLTAGLTFRANF